MAVYAGRPWTEVSCRKVVRRVFGNERPEVITGCRKLREDDFRSIVYK